MAEVKLDLGSLRRGTKKNGYVDWDDFIDVINSITTLITEIKADQDANKTVFDDHSHWVVVDDTVDVNTSKPEDGTPGVVNGTLVTFAPALTAATPDTLALEN